uniref:Uncharacterized protein n=1 Tax=viral metagenome TaxID=1070528 RepID=A0A6C0KFM1_9ZZZZ
MHTYKTSLYRRQKVCNEAIKNIKNIKNDIKNIRDRGKRIWNVVSYFGAVYNMSVSQQVDLATECVIYSYEKENIEFSQSYEETHLMIKQTVDLDDLHESNDTCLCF